MPDEGAPAQSETELGLRPAYCSVPAGAVAAARVLASMPSLMPALALMPGTDRLAEPELRGHVDQPLIGDWFFGQPRVQHLH